MFIQSSADSCVIICIVDDKLVTITVYVYELVLLKETEEGSISRPGSSANDERYQDTPSKSFQDERYEHDPLLSKSYLLLLRTYLVRIAPSVIQLVSMQVLKQCRSTLLT